MLPRKKKKGEQGVNPVLKTLGVMAGATPALSESVALGVVNNTFEETKDQLGHNGVDISIKRLRTISRAFSLVALDNRQEEVDALLGGIFGQTSPSLAGKRVGITMDGGRIRTRVTKKGRIKKGGKRKGFHTDWREPKVYTIYELDENGKRKKGGITVCDGTLENVDAFIDILAAAMIKLGVENADEVVFVADGALWIWDHVDTLVELSGVDITKVTRVLDFYHAAEHLFEVSELLYKSQAKQTAWFNKMRKMLKNRSPKVFLAELKKSTGNPKNKDLKRELNYFTKNLKSINYRLFRRKSLPMGSGVIESTIRRVVNLRLKGAGMFWLKENAEGFLHLRCQLKAGNWKEFFMCTIERIAKPV